MPGLRRVAPLLAGVVLAAVSVACSDPSHAAAPTTTRPTQRIPAPHLPNGTVVAPRSGVAGTSPTDEILTDDFGNYRDGVEPGGPSLLHIGSSSAWDDRTLGAVYGQPLVDGTTVYVATENDDVWALSAVNGHKLWGVSIGQSVKLSTVDSAPGLGGCGDINPLGITGTPVIDPALDEIFVTGEVQKAGTSDWQGIQHKMAAISIGGKAGKAGHILWERDVDPPGAGSTYITAAEQQRPAMTLANGRLYVPFGGLAGDCGSYQGYVVSLPEGGHGALTSFKVPTSREGAIWAVAGPSVSSSGELFAATGNSANGPGQKFDYGDAVLGLSPSLHLDGYFAPLDWAQLNVRDLDLGSDGPTILPDGSYVFETGKHSNYRGGVNLGYLLSPTHLGGLSGSRFNGTVCPNDGSAFGANVAAGVKVNGSVVTYVYVPCGAGTVAITVDEHGPSFRQAWQASTGSPNGPPIVAGGLVWALNWSTGWLYGMATTTGTVLVQRQVDALNHFATPSAGDGMLLIPTQGGVEAFRPPA